MMGTDNRTFNRTIQELKFQRRFKCRIRVPTFNRTIQELKLLCIIYFRRHRFF